MEIKDLRIGNLMYGNQFHSGEIVKVTSINKNNFTYNALNIHKQNYEASCSDNKLNPIQITEDILLKCGWVMYKKGNSTRFYHDDSFFDIEKHGDKYPFVIEDNEGKDGNIYYVCHSEFLHDFQNAYKTLNGNELTINFKL